MGVRDERPDRVAMALPLPVVVVDANLHILFVNQAAETFFGSSAAHMFRRKLDGLAGEGSPLVNLIGQARKRGGAVAEHGVAVDTPRCGKQLADLTAAPMPGVDGAVVLAVHAREFAGRCKRQSLSRDAARALSGMAAVLAHEIKNPLAGIRGAAQLLEEEVGENGRGLARLICEETNRIRGLIDQMEACGDDRPACFLPVNIHEVLDHVRKIARAGFARHVTFADTFDPSLPPVPGDRDRLVQVFVNLVRNAADAVGETGGEIVLTTAFRSGMGVRGSDGHTRRALPLEISVRDNGGGIPADLMPYIFDPFVTTKQNGAGLGLALVARIVTEHGGTIECESAPGRTVFRVLLPLTQEQNNLSFPARAFRATGNPD